MGATEAEMTALQRLVVERVGEGKFPRELQAPVVDLKIGDMVCNLCDQRTSGTTKRCQTPSGMPVNLHEDCFAAVKAVLHLDL